MDNSKNEMTLDFTNGETATIEFSDTDISFKEGDPEKVNVIESISVNDDELEVSPCKNVNIKVTSGKENGSISVNDKDVKVTGLGSAAYLNEEDIKVNVDVSGEINSAIKDLNLGTASKSNVEDFEVAGSIDKAIENLHLGTASEADVNDFEKAGSVESAIDGLNLGSAAFKESESFDVAGAARTVQDNLDEVEGRVTTLEGKEVGDENTIESISVNGTPQAIDENKNVDITVAGGDSYWEEGTRNFNQVNQQAMCVYYNNGNNINSNMIDVIIKANTISVNGNPLSGNDYDFALRLSNKLVIPDGEDVTFEIDVYNTATGQSVRHSKFSGTWDSSKKFLVDNSSDNKKELSSLTRPAYNYYGYFEADDGYAYLLSKNPTDTHNSIYRAMNIAVIKYTDSIDNLGLNPIENHLSNDALGVKLEMQNLIYNMIYYIGNYYPINCLHVNNNRVLGSNRASGLRAVDFKEGSVKGAFDIGGHSLSIHGLKNMSYVDGFSVNGDVLSTLTITADSKTVISFQDGLDDGTFKVGGKNISIGGFSELSERVSDLENAPAPVIPEVTDYWNVTVETGENQTASNTYSGRCSEPFFGEIILFGQDWQMIQLFGQAQLSEPLPLLDVDEQTVTMKLRAKDIYDDTWTYNETFTGIYHKDDNDIIWNRETKEQVTDSMSADSGLDNEFGYVANAEGNPYLIFSGVLSSLPFDYEVEFSTVAVGENTNRLTPKDTYAIQPLKIITSSGEFIYDGTKPVTIDLT